ncbi:MAG TPA: hypothetical protein VMM60_09055 [Ilumatobacter sp.]|nr:hypothetical protein [Ilumatobacter sp.]
MIWLVLAAVVVVGAAVAFGVRLANDSRRAVARGIEVVPGVASQAPAAWAGAHSPEAKLHRRLRDAVASAHTQVELAGSSSTQTASLDQAAVTLSNRLVAAAALPARHRQAAIDEVGTLIGRFEDSVAALATQGVAHAELDAAFERSMTDIHQELEALAQARAEVDEIEREA